MDRITLIQDIGQDVASQVRRLNEPHSQSASSVNGQSGAYLLSRRRMGQETKTGLLIINSNLRYLIRIDNHHPLSASLLASEIPLKP